jgi:chromosome segregation ATPase
MTTEERLTTVEDDLDSVKKLLASAARYAESANQGLDRLTERFDGLTVKVDELTMAQAMTQTQLDRLGSRVDQLVESQAQTQTQLGQLTQKVDQLTERVDSFVYHAQRLFAALGERLVPVEGQTERFEPVIKMLARNYEAQQSQLREFQVSTTASLERIDRILDYLLKQSGGSIDQ